MTRKSWRPRGRAWIGVTYFFMAFAPGLWYPALPNILAAQGLESSVTWALFWISGFTILSPLLLGAWADQKVRADRLLGVLSLSGACFLFLAFHGLHAGWGAFPFLACLAANALISGPMWSLLSSIALSHGQTPERSFPFFRIWGTMGWLSGGIFTSFVLEADANSTGGMTAAGVRCVVGLACLGFLPATLPKGGAARNWKERLGLGALMRLSSRDERVFLATSFLLSIGLTAYMMHVPRHLEALGARHITAMMTVGQIIEIPAILCLGLLTERYRFKWILAVAMAAAVVRYLFFASGEVHQSVALMLGGIFLHGICYTLFFITGQLFIERRGTPGTRSQGQALYGLLSGGLGVMAGAPISGVLYQHVVLDGHGGWPWFWNLHAAFCLAVFLFFWFGYQGQKRTVEMEPDESE